jgi:hypothetical protein
MPTDIARYSIELFKPGSEDEQGTKARTAFDRIGTGHGWIVKPLHDVEPSLLSEPSTTVPFSAIPSAQPRADVPSVVSDQARWLLAGYVPILPPTSR